jgi:hypothetical protein
LTDEHHARHHRRTRALAELGLTHPDEAIFTALYYGIHVYPAVLPAAAAREYYCPDRPVTEGECRAALADCLARGRVQVVDKAALARIDGELRAGRVLGPAYGFPPVGCVDFTRAGADLWLRLCGSLKTTAAPPFAYPSLVHTKTARYFRTWVAAEAAAREIAAEGDVVAVTDPVPVGPWRAQWWRRFPAGYRIDVERRMSGVGRSPDGCGSTYLAHSPGPADLRRLRPVLDRHNVAPAEWFFLAAMEVDLSLDAARLLRWVAERARAGYGVAISGAEWQGGLDACLRYGWLREVDEDAIAEVDALVWTDPALWPVPRAAADNRGGIDFTPVGAALYRRIAAAWLGPGWEDRLVVERDLAWEEHRYCEAEGPLRDVGHEYEGRGLTIRSGRVVSIGPWCVHWWERFSAGYRLELQVAVP